MFSVLTNNLYVGNIYSLNSKTQEIEYTAVVTPESYCLNDNIVKIASQIPRADFNGSNCVVGGTDFLLGNSRYPICNFLAFNPSAFSPAKQGTWSS